MIPEVTIEDLHSATNFMKDNPDDWLQKLVEWGAVSGHAARKKDVKKRPSLATLVRKTSSHVARTKRIYKDSIREMETIRPGVRFARFQDLHTSHINYASYMPRLELKGVFNSRMEYFWVCEKGLPGCTSKLLTEATKKWLKERGKNEEDF